VICNVLAALAVPSVAMIGQMFLGCDRAASVAFFTVALTVNGAVCGGYLGNGLDIAPNFSGTVQFPATSNTDFLYVRKSEVGCAKSMLTVLSGEDKL
jgi:hypothetical protein